MRRSKHFSVSELRCRCCGVDGTETSLIDALEELRAIVGRPLIITSAYRCEEHNTRVGGGQSSQHVQGRAADIVVPQGLSMREFYEAIERIPAFRDGGVGLYPENNFAHVDIRGRRARWSRIGGVYLGIGAALNKKKSN